MGRHARTLEHPEHLGRHFHALFFAIDHHGDGVQIVTKWAFRPVFGVQNIIANMRDAGKPKTKACHNRDGLYHPEWEAATNKSLLQFDHRGKNNL